MAKNQRWTTGVAVILTALAWTSSAGGMEARTPDDGQPPLMAPDARVRGVSPRMVAVINDAAARSNTFRGLVDQIGTTDGVVYVAEGHCGHGARACLLLTMTIMGPYRVLRILVDPQEVDAELGGSIAHELQHAIEVISHRSIRSGSAMTLLFNKEGDRSGRRFETNAATKAGDIVRAELRARTAVRKRCE
jgi:hypothetical protein